ncbi:Uncharacterised protein [Sphingobacterium multivorum]|uniref:Uncharacterized protein n=1 Tax=Sphingobacterium multivorum TaxID=28454 RepID=A0A2X2JFI0_SPHMU|nr:Uncharacterised protein [Sphingobacterium multivorum]
MKELLALLRQKRENLKFGGGIDKIKKLKEKAKCQPGKE